MSRTKAELLEIMAARGIEVPTPVPTKPKVIELINAHSQNRMYHVDELIKEAGHEILRLRPYGCELNPIELVWSQFKGNTRAKNTSPTLSGTVVELLREEERKPSYKQLWRDCCEHVKKIEASESRGLQDVEPVIFNVGVDTDEEDISDEEDVDNPGVPEDIVASV